MYARKKLNRNILATAVNNTLSLVCDEVINNAHLRWAKIELSEDDLKGREKVDEAANGYLINNYRKNVAVILPELKNGNLNFEIRFEPGTSNEKSLDILMDSTKNICDLIEALKPVYRKEIA